MENNMKNLQELQKFISFLRANGVVKYKDSDFELVLGPQEVALPDTVDLSKVPESRREEVSKYIDENWSS